MNASMKNGEPAAAPSHRRLRQMVWFVGLWLAGVVVLGVVASLIRLMVHV